MSLYTAKAPPAYRQRLGYHSMLLAGLCCIVGSLMLLGNLTTYEKIQAELREDKLELLRQVLPAHLYDNDLLQNRQTLTGNGLSEPWEVYVATLNGEVTGYAFSASQDGYSGTISLLVGIDANDEVLGVRVISHTETPGLGDKIELAKDDWILSFNGHSLGNLPESRWAVQKDGGDFDQFTGATITPRAVVKGVYQSLQQFQANKYQLSSTKPGTDTQEGASHVQ